MRNIACLLCSLLRNGGAHTLLRACELKQDEGLLLHLSSPEVEFTTTATTTTNNNNKLDSYVNVGGT